MIFLGTYNRAGAVTFTGLILSLAACWLSYHHRLPWAVVCLIFSGLCDLFDGWVARRFNRSPAEATFGLQIDSLVDMTAFGLTPVVILLHSGMDAWFDFPFLALYLCAAAMRLAHFNQSRAGGGPAPSHYTGLPVTYAALVFPLVLLLVRYSPPAVLHWIIRGTIAMLTILFVLHVPIPKPKGKAYAVFVVLALGMTYAWLAVDR